MKQKPVADTDGDDGSSWLWRIPAAIIAGLVVILLEPFVLVERALARRRKK
jgi:hypothetical protein